jgi:branched-chain amino acid transport system substrate-binding protein
MKRRSQFFAASLAVLAAILLAPAPAATAADLKIGVIAPLSGPIASQGVPTSRGIQAAMKYRSEVGGRKVTLVQLDDASDPSASARAARKLIDDEKVDVIIGTGGVPGSMAIATICRESKTPFVSYTPLVPSGDDSAWAVTTAQPAPLMINAVVEHMKKAGVKTIGYIGFSDSWGDLAYNSLEKSATAAGMRVVTNERYARSDSSIAGQILKIVAAKPDAVIGGTAGTPGALPYITLSDRGYKGAIYGTHGIINPDFVRVTGAAGQGLLAPTGPVMVAEQLPDSHPSKKVAADFRAAYQAVHNALPGDAFSAYAFDSWLVALDAAARVSPKLEPGTPEYRAALRDAIFATKDLAVTHGVLTFKAGTPYGADSRSVVVVKLDKGQWRLQP